METLALNSVSSSEIIKSEELQSKIETLEQKSKEMDESIRYAGRLQQSILPNEVLFKNSFNDMI